MGQKSQNDKNAETLRATQEMMATFEVVHEAKFAVTDQRIANSDQRIREATQRMEEDLLQEQQQQGGLGNSVTNPEPNADGDHPDLNIG